VSASGPVKTDPRLWFRMDRACRGKPYLLGASHTFPGRFTAWCPLKKRTANCSVSDVTEASLEAEYRLLGFLAGNEPHPPRGPGGLFVDSASAAFRTWEKKARRFRNTGVWRET